MTKTKAPSPATTKRSATNSKRGGAQASRSSGPATTAAKKAKRAPTASSRAKTAGKIVVIDGTEFFDALPSDRPPAKLQLPARPGHPTLYRPVYCAIALRLGAQGYSLTGIAGRLGVARDTIYEWARRHSEFSDALQRAKAAAVAFYEGRLIHITQRGGGVGSAAAAIFALKARASSEWLPPRAPDLGELPDDSALMKDVTPDIEAPLAQRQIVERALQMFLSVDEKTVTPEMLHAVVINPIVSEPPTEQAPAVETSITKALASLKAKGCNGDRQAAIVDASLAEFLKRSAGEVDAPAPAAAPPIADDALEIIPPAPRKRVRTIDI